MRREYIVTIWPTGYEYREEMYNYYKGTDGVFGLSNMETILFNSAEEFMKFIYKIYEKDSLSREILAYKSKLMVKMKLLNCAVFKFSFDSDIAVNEVDPNVLNIKTEIRKIIAAKMENYYYDILLHMTDTINEFEYLSEVMYQYGVEFKGVTDCYGV